MTPLPASDDPQTILERVHTLLETATFVPAVRLLLDQLEPLLEYNSGQPVYNLLSHFPRALFDEDPDLRYIAGFVYAKVGLFQEALNLLERARFSYTTNREYVQAVRCDLELARLCLSRDNFRTAYYYLHDEVQPLIERGSVPDQQLQAHFFLRMAELCPDIGKLRDSIEYAKKAWTLYKGTDNVAGQFDALVRLTSTATNIGDHAEATSKLELAESCYTIGNLGLRARARLLNLSIHQNWYQGHFAEALTQAYTYVTLVDQGQFNNFRLYARVLLGNLHRTLGEFGLAQQWYLKARTLVAQLDYQFYTPWIDMQMAWLRVLEGRLTEARTFIHASLRTSDLGQAMSFQVVLAVLNLLDGSLSVAERLLHESLTYYTESGDLLACCALQFYLALTDLRSGQRALANHHLRQAIGWLAQQRLDSFPHWWHPALMSEICAYALTTDIFPDVAERIFINRLGKAGSSVLHELLYNDNHAARAYAGRLLYLIEGDTFNGLMDVADVTCKAILEDLLYQGKLQRTSLARLTQLLLTAQQRKTPNPTLLTVFALYVNGYARGEIAEKIGCSVANVRNYINLLYHIFAIPNEGFPNRRERQKRLIERARSQGFI